MRFDELDLEDEILDGLEDMNFHEMTPVQEHTIPVILEGRDIIGCAQTGTGKTAAYTLPLLNKLLIEGNPDNVVKSLIIVPTRELAQQIDQQFQGFSYYAPLSTTVVYGGGDGKGWDIQKNGMLNGADVVIATPGRMIAHLQNSGVDLSHVEYLILDEADRMLDMGFIHDVTRILDKLSSRRNLGMFSATISREVMDISWMYQRDPEEITVQAKEENKPDIAQYRIDVGQNDKAHVMAQIIRAEGHERVMAFCNTKGMTERLKAFLMMEGLEADCIHGDIPQKKREAVMARFRRGELPIFVATDVAARGIDVDDVDAVFNYDVPLENEYYVHRIGRTGRAKRRGVAYTLVSDYPSGMRLDGIAKFTGNEVKKAHLDAEGKLVED